MGGDGGDTGAGYSLQSIKCVCLDRGRNTGAPADVHPAAGRTWNSGTETSTAQNVSRGGVFLDKHYDK